MDKFLKDNSTEMRLMRTILQGLIGVLVANLDLFVSFIRIDPSLKPVIVAAVMAVLSPVMSELGKSNGES